MKSNHRTSIIKSLGPMIGISYFLLIFFIKPNSISIIYLLNVCIGVFSLSVLFSLLLRFLINIYIKALSFIYTYIYSKVLMKKMILISPSSICLPISLELGADLTYTIMTPDSSAAILYITGNGQCSNTHLIKPLFKAL